MKFRSSMTLFAAIAPEGSPFEAALARFYGGAADPRTRALIDEAAGGNLPSAGSRAEG